MQNDTSETSVLLVDDHGLVVELVKTFLSATGGFSVTTSSDLATGLATIQQAGKFDVVLLDVGLPGLSGIREVGKVVEANGGGGVVLFSGSVSASFVEQAIKVGASGFIPKTLPLRALTSAIRIVAVGQTFLPSTVTFGNADTAQSGESRLTKIEAAVMQHLGSGLANKEIGHRLQMTESTVKMHVRTICRKLGARNRTHAVILGRADGLL